MYKLIASDLDGTLLRTDKTISDETLNFIQKLDRKGILFVPSTGRCHNELPDAIANQPFLHYALTCNGGGIYDYDHQRYLNEVVINAAVASDFIRFCRPLPLKISIVVEGHRYIESENDMPQQAIQISPPKVLANIMPCPDLIEKLKQLNRDVQKILLYFDDEKTRNDLLPVFSSRFENLVFSSSSNKNMEINAQGVDKGHGLKMLCEILKLDLSETVVFGDAGNDLAILDVAGLACVMANGTDEAKKHADCLCPDNNSDGVRVKLEELFSHLD